MGMNVGDWYSDPAQRYNDVIYPQKERIRQEKDWSRYDRKMPKPEKAENAPAKELSPAAQKLLDKLKKTYDNVDFSVSESNDSADAKAKLAGGTKKYSVLFTNDELEKMASDFKYQNMMTSRMHEAFQTVAKESSRLGPDAVDPVTKGVVKSVSVVCNIYGSSSVHKEMAEPVGAQKNRMEELREKRAAQKREHHNRPPVKGKYHKKSRI